MAILDRYDALAGDRPVLAVDEWGVVAQLLRGLAGVRDISALWAELLDRAREGERPPGVDAEELACKLRRMVPVEQITGLEVADQVAAGTGSLRERLIAAGIGGTP
jgi:hypothetical protein